MVIIKQLSKLTLKDKFDSSQHEDYSSNDENQIRNLLEAKGDFHPRLTHLLAEKDKSMKLRSIKLHPSTVESGIEDISTQNQFQYLQATDVSRHERSQSNDIQSSQILSRVNSKVSIHPKQTSAPESALINVSGIGLSESSLDKLRGGKQSKQALKRFRNAFCVCSDRYERSFTSSLMLNTNMSRDRIQDTQLA